MRGFELYQAVLGLKAPWTVANVELDVTGQQVTVTVEAGPGPYPCSECQESVPGYDRKRRRWRRLDTCQFTTWLQADVPRVSCPTHGGKQIVVPWAEPGGQFTDWISIQPTRKSEEPIKDAKHWRVLSIATITIRRWIAHGSTEGWIVLDSNSSRGESKELIRRR